MLKKCLPLGLLLPCVIVHAGAMGCKAGEVTIPCPNNAWDVGVTALYLKPSSMFHNPLVQEQPTDDSQTQRFIKTPWDWGYKLEGSYHFNTGNDVNVNWLHFDDSYSRTYSSSSSDLTRLNYNTKFNIVNFELAQTTNIGDQTHARFYAGVQYANFKNNLGRVFTDANGTSLTYALANYRGAGPRLGADLTHELPHGFNVFAQGAMALLIGQGKGKDFSATTQSVYNHKQMVPELEVNLGLGYDVNMAKGTLSLSGGWMLQRYFDAILVNDYKTNHDFSLNGPFIRAKWLGNV